ncbi:MAG TPA: VOC family protein [Solirubrobacteraceae bacterium]|nr:VOC family protein [Solirubrobacteraceae bacterium]
MFYTFVRPSRAGARAALCDPSSTIASPLDTQPARPASGTLPAALRLGRVELTVTDLDRSIAFYEESIGLRLARRDGAVAALGAGGEDLLVLVEDPSARPAERHAGLYHFALLHSSRSELARAAQRLVATRTPISGASDHGISEAIYLSDPDGNGIELAADRPRERWGDLSDPTTVGPRPLDLDGLLSLVHGSEPQPKADSSLVVGHVHLHVGDIERGLAFYRDVIGFEVMTLFPSAAFVSAGGYHHHLAFNTWRGEGVPPAPDGAVGLRHWTVILPTAADLAALRERVASAGVGDEPVASAGVGDEAGDGALVVRDPWNNAAVFAVEPAGARTD